MTEKPEIEWAETRSPLDLAVDALVDYERALSDHPDEEELLNYHETIKNMLGKQLSPEERNIARERADRILQEKRGDQQ
jgi:hypothetical protein